MNKNYIVLLKNNFEDDIELYYSNCEYYYEFNDVVFVKNNVILDRYNINDILYIQNNSGKMVYKNQKYF